MTSPFGILPSGEMIEKHVLKNSRGFSVEVIPYGATLVSIYAPDRHGNFADAVLGFSALGDIILRPGQPRSHTTIYAFSTD